MHRQASADEIKPWFVFPIYIIILQFLMILSLFVFNIASIPHLNTTQ